MATQQKKSAQRHGFKTGEYIVYPAHGVGQISSIDEQEVAGHKLELFVIDFQKDKMRLKVPVAKATSIGMRKLSETDYVDLEAVNAESGDIMAREQAEVLSKEQVLTSLGQATTKLRQKLGDDPTEPNYIRTESGVGYRLVFGGEGLRT